jgi:hypothetical protein
MVAVKQDIRNNGASGSKIARALSGEGYAGGYRAALIDVKIALEGNVNNNSRYWPQRSFNPQPTGGDNQEA